MTNVQFAILLQGLIKKEYNFTLETAKLYKNYYPEAALILSVWDSEPESLLEEFRKIGCIVCLSKTFEKKIGLRFNKFAATDNFNRRKQGDGTWLYSSCKNKNRPKNLCS